MAGIDWVRELKASREFFERATRALEEADSGFRPSGETMTAAQQVAHVARTVHWFVDGASKPEGFDLDFEAHMAQLESVASLEAARAEIVEAYDRATAYYGGLSAEELAAPMAAGPIMGGEPRVNTLTGIIDHSAHHRGSLSVYTRLLGKVPPMPYMDM